MTTESDRKDDERLRAAGLLPGQVEPETAARMLRRTQEDAAGRRRAPGAIWTPDIVAGRMVEAFGTLRRLPDKSRPRQFGVAWPAYIYDRADIQGQGAQARLEFFKGRNRVMVQATPDDIRRMTEALSWPMDYLRDTPEVARAVCQAAQWVLAGIPLDRGTAAAKVSRRTFGRRRLHGETVIAAGLTRDGIKIS